MGQRVRLQYTVDIDDYEDEVVRLLAGAIVQLQGSNLQLTKRTF